MATAMIEAGTRRSARLRGEVKKAPAGVLRLPLDGASNAGKVLQLLEDRLKQLEPLPAHGK